MAFDFINIVTVLPEIVLLSMACVVLLIDLYTDSAEESLSYYLTQFTMVIVAAVIIIFAPEKTVLVFDGAYVSDNLSFVLKLSLCLLGFVVFVFSKKLLEDLKLDKSEYYALALFAMLGMMVMISAGNFLTIYLGLELLSLSLYSMIAMQRDSKRLVEVAMKYFVLGAVASGMLLYGISMIYGVTKSIQFDVIHEITMITGQSQLIMIFGLVFIVIGVAFKLGAVPFHMWLPDVYHGSSLPITLFIGSITKIAAFALIARVLVDGLEGLHASWKDMLAILAVLSLILGNIIAIAQKNIKRMFAYSTISHVGFIMLGLIAGNQLGYSASMFYTLVYALMATAGFGVLLMLSKNGIEAENIADLSGLSDRSPLLAVVMLVVMFSMAGVPPTVGFYAKLSVINAIVSSDMIWLALVAVFMSVVGAFYYLRIIKVMYFEKQDIIESVDNSFNERLFIGVNGLTILLLGLYPTTLMMLCSASFK